MESIVQSFAQAAPSLLKEWVWPAFWQSSLLIGVLFLIDILMGRLVRPAIRYALWMLLLVKLVLPPGLASPTSPAWWARRANPASSVPITTEVVTYGNPVSTEQPRPEAGNLKLPTRAVAPFEAWLLLLAGLVSLGLLAWMLRRWRQVVLTARRATPAPAELEQILEGARVAIRSQRAVHLRLSQGSGSPWVSGFFRPVILLPQPLADQLSPGQLLGVLLHELIHLRRYDIWINCAQTLLQIVYWWHPLLWAANIRIRRLREEAVDDEVMNALREEAESYPQTLIEVAKLALRKPLSSLALVGILEARHALRQRIERLVDLPGPPRAGLTLVSVLTILAFSVVALPMGPAPVKPAAASRSGDGKADFWPDPRFPGYAQVSLAARFFIVNASSLKLFLPSAATGQSPLIFRSNEVAGLEKRLSQAEAQSFPRGEMLTFAQFSGGRFHYQIGGVTNNLVNYQTRTRPGGGTVVIGAECSYRVATRPDWVPLEFTSVPWTEPESTRCQVQLGILGQPGTVKYDEVAIPAGGAMLWVMSGGTSPGKMELVLLSQDPGLPDQRARTEAPPETDPAGRTAKANALVQTARLALESGKLDDAEAMLRQAISMDRQCQAAYYYLDRVNQARVKPIPPANLFFDSVSSPDASLTTEPATNFYTRVIRVDPKTFLNRLSKENGNADLSAPEAIMGAFRGLFLSKGIDMRPPRSFFFNDREGMLMVHATLQELDRIEQALAEFNPPQVNVKVRFLKISPAMVAALGKGLGITDAEVTNLSKILTPPQSKVILKALEANGGSALLDEASVTTLSGRQTRVECVDAGNVATNQSPSQTPLGPAIELVPSVSGDGCWIGLTAVASLAEAGGDALTKDPSVAATNGRTRTPAASAARSRLRRIAAHNTVPDGYSLLLANPVDENGKAVEKPGSVEPRFAVLITPTLIDAVGNRVHSEAEVEAIIR